MKKNFLLLLSMIDVFVAGCAPHLSLPTDEIPASATSIPAMETPALTLTPDVPAFSGTKISYGNLTLVVPPGVASGASGSEVPRVESEEAAWWQKTPGHLEVVLGDYYVLQGKSRQSRILVFPAQAYAELVPAAFESMHRLNNILGNPGVQIHSEELPVVPFFNEIQVFAADIQVVPFQNGQGVRFLTEYGQSATSANNHDLFYEFQGLTNDGLYYIVVILPVTAPGLGDSGDPAEAALVEGIAFPSIGDLNADWDGYYTAVTAFLNAIPAEAFSPSLNQLDTLIQSIQVTP